MEGDEVLLWALGVIFTRNTIHICCDVRTALAAFAKTTTTLSLIWKCMQVLGRRVNLTKSV
jgi:hypothetical protein